MFGLGGGGWTGKAHKTDTELTVDVWGKMLTTC